MTGLKALAAAFVLTMALGASARAQGTVPGGWAPQFGYQTIGVPGAVGTPNFGFNNPYGLYSPYGGYGNFPTASGYYPPYGYGPPGYLPRPLPQTANATGPLIQAIRSTTRRRGR
jgi:hypothetical protein